MREFRIVYILIAIQLFLPVYIVAQAVTEKVYISTTNMQKLANELRTGFCHQKKVIYQPASSSTRKGKFPYCDFEGISLVRTVQKEDAHVYLIGVNPVSEEIIRAVQQRTMDDQSTERFATVQERQLKIDNRFRKWLAYPSFCLTLCSLACTRIPYFAKTYMNRILVTAGLSFVAGVLGYLSTPVEPTRQQMNTSPWRSFEIWNQAQEKFEDYLYAKIPHKYLTNQMPADSDYEFELVTDPSYRFLLR